MHFRHSLRVHKYGSQVAEEWPDRHTPPEIKQRWTDEQNKVILARGGRLWDTVSDDGAGSGSDVDIQPEESVSRSAELPRWFRGGPQDSLTPPLSVEGSEIYFSIPDPLESASRKSAVSNMTALGPSPSLTPEDNSCPDTPSRVSVASRKSSLGTIGSHEWNDDNQRELPQSQKVDSIALAVPSPVLSEKLLEVSRPDRKRRYSESDLVTERILLTEDLVPVRTDFKPRSLRRSSRLRRAESKEPIRELGEPSLEHQHKRRCLISRRATI